MNNYDYLAELKKKYIILGIEENREGDSFYVCAIEDNEGYTAILLKDVKRIKHQSILNIRAKYHEDDKSKKVLKIGDIIIANKFNGNGHILLTYLFKYADENKDIVKIIGEISPIDKDHFDRLEDFYKEHGFKVVFFTNNNGERTGGYIEKDLSN